MMSTRTPVSTMSLWLAICAGFCDAVSYFSEAKIFSSHMTGNIITFVYDLLHFNTQEDWGKLIALPVFLLGGMVAGWISKQYPKENSLLIVLASLLAAGTLFALFEHDFNGETIQLIHIAGPFLLVFTMGVQGAFNRLRQDSALGSTIAMTGNITQFSLDLDKLIFGQMATAFHEFKGQIILIGGFFTGAFAGGLLSHYIGFGALFVPTLIIFSLSRTY